MNFDSVSFRDRSGLQNTIEELGEWAVFAFNLGYKSFVFSENGKRCVSIVSVPSRELFTAIVALGAVVADASSFQGNGMLSWESFVELEEEQLVYFTDRNKVVRGYLGGFNEEFQARAIIDAKSVTHFVTKRNFNNYEIRFDSPKSKGNSADEENLLLDLLNCGFGINVDRNWLRTVYPAISLNIVKHRFTSSFSDVELVCDEQKIDLTIFLGLTESLKLGSGKILLKSEKNSSTAFNPKLAILSSGSFDRLIREYSFSDLVIAVEHHEYDESVGSVSRTLRQAGEDSPETCAFSERAPDGVKVISKVMRRAV